MEVLISAVQKLILYNFCPLPSKNPKLWQDLGPLLFLLYINDLDETTVEEVLAKLFADDPKEHARRENSSELQIALDNFGDWSERWQMKIAKEKCFVLSVGNRSVGPRLYFFKVTH